MTAPDMRLLLPRRLDVYEGPAFTAWFLAIYNVVGTARSLVHVLAPDSGAGTIAGIDTTAGGGANAIGLLGQWGGAQLLVALFIWIVLWRYRGLVPLMIAGSMFDNLLRVGIGQYKPLDTLHTPPGAVSWVVAPLCAFVLLSALMPKRRVDTAR